MNKTILTCIAFFPSNIPRDFRHVEYKSRGQSRGDCQSEIMGPASRLDLLPTELQLKILQHLDYKDARSVQKACRVAPLNLRPQFHMTGVKAAEAFLAYIKHKRRLFFKRLIIAPLGVKSHEVATMCRLLDELTKVCMNDLRVERFVFLWREQPYDVSPIIRNLKPSQVVVEYESFRLIDDVRVDAVGRIFPFVSEIKILNAPFDVFEFLHWYRQGAIDMSDVADVFPNAKLG